MSDEPQKQLCCYDVTMSCDYMEYEDVVKHLRGWAKKFVFQKEQGDTGYLHWQIRLSLIKKRRLCELKGKLFPKGHISITSKTVHDGNTFNYVMKEDTRIDGPWTDQDCEEPPQLTRQLRTFMGHNKYPYQEKIWDLCKFEDDRSINVIYDPVGDAGKTVFVEFMEYKGVGYEIPPFRQMEDIMQCVMSVKPKKCYYIDMPKGMKKDKLGEFYAGLECLKNGLCYDKRYAFKKRRMDRPQVFVFTNRLPVLELLSIDRWVIWEMTADKDLRRLDLVSVDP